MVPDFGRTAKDYARHRPGFPPAFFEHVHGLGIGVAGQRVLDLGTGTGALALGFAQAACQVVGIDPSAAMLAEATAASARAGLTVSWVRAHAETTGLSDADFDLVCAGQCWHWFDRPLVAAEVFRLLRSGGHVVIAYFSYLPHPGSVADATEQLVLRYNPTWPWAGEDGRYPQFANDLVTAGLRHTSTFDVVLPVTFTHESWRGRFRACNGVLALPEETMEAFDVDLQRLLVERFPEPLVCEHRLYGIVAEKRR
jgi:ubiquinone/menaquinone biosynthesis C-methylase UbiE